MKYLLLLFAIVVLSSCWKIKDHNYTNPPYGNPKKVWGSRPVYAAEGPAKLITYISQKMPIVQAGNIYALGNFIFQVDVGRGIHVIDNTQPSKADRIGFITIQGCQQISIKGSYLYTNSYGDLVTIDIADPLNVREVNRLPNAFPELRYNYPLSQPEESGYYTCPRYDSVVVGWVKDSVYMGCFKN